MFGRLLSLINSFGTKSVKADQTVDSTIKGLVTTLGAKIDKHYIKDLESINVMQMSGQEYEFVKRHFLTMRAQKFEKFDAYIRKEKIAHLFTTGINTENDLFEALWLIRWISRSQKYNRDLIFCEITNNKNVDFRVFLGNWKYQYLRFLDELIKKFNDHNYDPLMISNSNKKLYVSYDNGEVKHHIVQ